MKVKTSRFGEIEVKEEQIVGFPLGLPGFTEEKGFIFIESEPGSPFCFMQSAQKPDLVFVVTNPRVFFPDYELHVSSDALAFLEVEKEEDMLVYVILSIPEDFHRTTANLLAPVLISIKHNRGIQAIPPQSPYLTNHLIFPQDGKKQAQAR
ncbi:MAG: flagellar assembly protein FliW [Chitinophagales bacterium]